MCVTRYFRWQRRRRCFVQWPPTQPMSTALSLCHLPLPPLLSLAIFMCMCVWLCAQSVCKQTAYKLYTRPGSRGSRAEASGHAKQTSPPPPPTCCCPVPLPLPRLYPPSPLASLVYRVGSIRLDKQDDRGRLQLSSFKRIAIRCCVMATRGLSHIHSHLAPPHVSLGYMCGSSSSTKPISQKTKKA